MVRSGCSYLFRKVLLGATATAFVLLLLVGTLTSGATKLETTSLNGRPMGNFRHDKVVAGDKLVYNPKLGLNFVMSKRKVPNGPDPIHNRAGKSRRPPGRA